MKKFRLLKNSLYSQKSNGVSTLRVENDDYYVAFNYFCDYMEDLKNDSVDIQNLSVVVKMKADGDGMPMVYSSSEDDIFINLCRYPNHLLDDNDVDNVIYRLKKAREVKNQLLGYVRKIAG